MDAIDFELRYDSPFPAHVIEDPSAWVPFPPFSTSVGPSPQGRWTPTMAKVILTTHRQSLTTCRHNPASPGISTMCEQRTGPTLAIHCAKPARRGVGRVRPKTPHVWSAPTAHETMATVSTATLQEEALKGHRDGGARITQPSGQTT